MEKEFYSTPSVQEIVVVPSRPVLQASGDPTGEDEG